MSRRVKLKAHPFPGAALSEDIFLSNGKVIRRGTPIVLANTAGAQQ